MTGSEGWLTLPAGSAAAGDRLFVRRWPSTGPARATVVIAHGYDEHSGRYGHVADHLVQHGFSVLALDHWGHGRSDGEAGYVPAFSVYHDGLDALLATIDDRPLILLGHSLGGLIATTYLLTHQDQFAAAVLSGPAIKASDEPSAFLKAVSALLSRVTPKLGVVPLDANAISRDPDVVADYLGDPMVSGRKISARLGAEMMRNMERVQANARQITLPILLMHGEEDQLADPAGSRILATSVGSDTRELLLYPDLYHEIFNEPEKARVLTDMTDWLDDVLPPVAGR